MRSKKSSRKSARCTRAQLQRIYDLASEMSACGSYMDHDPDTGEALGTDSEIVAALKVFRRQFRLRG